MKAKGKHIEPERWCIWSIDDMLFTSDHCIVHPESGLVEIRPVRTVNKERARHGQEKLCSGGDIQTR